MKKLAFRLSLVFGAALCVGVSLAADIHFVGDSTLAPRKEKDMAGSWGEALGSSLAEGVKLHDWAVSGRSTKSFMPRWEGSVRGQIRSGDWVVVQFGINDPHHNNPKTSKPGQLDRYCTVDEFRANLSKYAADIRACGANPLFCTPLSSRAVFDKKGAFDAKKRGPRYPYAQALAEVAAAEKIPLVDMFDLSEKAIVAAGDDASKVYFCQKPEKMDNTHPSKAGAKKFAELFLNDVRTRKLDVASLFVGK